MAFPPGYILNTTHKKISKNRDAKNLEIDINPVTGYNEGMQEIITSRDALDTNLTAPKIDPVFMTIAHEVVKGHSVMQIADTLDISADRVAQVLDREEVKNYINTIYLSQGYSNPFNLRKIAEQVIEAKMLEAQETGQFSKKDLLDWVKMMKELTEMMMPKKSAPQTAIQINNSNYHRLLEGLTDG